MYTISVRREFSAQHFMIGGDFGPENEKHSHHYRAEVELSGENLDQFGFLMDITEIEKRLDEVVGVFRDQTLNDLTEFGGLNPSLERFTKVFCLLFANQVQYTRIHTILIRIWENENAWASYQADLLQLRSRNMPRMA